MIGIVDMEVQPDSMFHSTALAESFPSGKRYNIIEDGLPAIDELQGIVVTGSSVGVYQKDEHGWIESAEEFIRNLRDKGIPTLGVCFGHQLINQALGGTVEKGETMHQIVEYEYKEDPLFDGVPPKIVALHGDYVIKESPEVDIIATADYCPIFATRHQTAPIWTIQGHPELREQHLPDMKRTMGWTKTQHRFAETGGEELIRNFVSLMEP